MTRSDGAPPDHLVIALAGDCVVASPILGAAAGIEDVQRILRSAHLAIGNLESAIVSEETARIVRPHSLDQMWVAASAEIATELEAIGFGALARANNHATDWGVEGTRDAGRALDAAGIVHAGTGEDADTARAPVFVDTAAGRVALVSTTMTFRQDARALPRTSASSGQPGVSGIRTRGEILLPHRDLEALRRIRASHARDAGWTVLDSVPDTLDFFGLHLRAADGPAGYRFEVEQSDAQAVIDSVRSARDEADLVVVSLHAHQPGNWSARPADASRALARALLDAGADVIFGHGPHRLRGVEIHRGKPIFYSLGNFIFQADVTAAARRVAAELSERSEPDDVAAVAAVWNMLTAGETDECHRAMIAVLTFSQRRLIDSRLIPIGLSGASSDGPRGVPHRARGTTAQSILEEVRRLSADLDTTIDIRDGEAAILGERSHDPSPRVFFEPEPRS